MTTIDRITDTEGNVVLFHTPRVIRGRRVKVARQSRGLSRVQLAAAIGCHWAQIVDLENDAGNSLTPEQIARMVAALEYPNGFFEREDDAPLSMYGSSLCWHHQWSELEIDAL